MDSQRHALVFSREYPPVTVGGTSTVARNLAAGLAERGWTISVVTTGPGAETDRRETVDGVVVVRTGTGTVYNDTTTLGDRSIRGSDSVLTVAPKGFKNRGIHEWVGKTAIMLESKDASIDDRAVTEEDLKAWGIKDSSLLTTVSKVKINNDDGSIARPTKAGPK